MSTATPERVRPGPGRQADRDISSPGRAVRVVAWLGSDSRSRAWLRRKAVAAWMNVLIFAAAAITVATAGFMAGMPWPQPQAWGVSALKLFTLWCLSFLPGWLYVRFLDLRARALWNEYVLNLHRLGWDLPWHLPMPPVSSAFYDRWAQGPHGHPGDNIYRQKFEAYYGRQITSVTERCLAAVPNHAGRAEVPNHHRHRDRAAVDDYPVSSESLFPVFLATAVLAVGWAAVLWNTRFVTDPAGPWDVLKYGFLGSYAFVTSMLIRRFFQSDLRPSAYATVVFRIMLVLLIVGVLHQVLAGTGAVTGHAELALAFVIGFFPLIGLQALRRVTSRALRTVVPAVTSDYPLDQLDGFNLWYEARLTEEGVEDMQNLTTMNLVDVILHTRVPPGRLVDWTDQAFLLTHLDPVDRDELTTLRGTGQRASAVKDAVTDAVTDAVQDAVTQVVTDAGKERRSVMALSGAQAMVRLRRVGIRTATDLLKAFSEEQENPSGRPPGRVFALPAGLDPPLPVDQLKLLVTVLAAEPGLTPVWNWQRNGVPWMRGGCAR